MPAQRIEIAEPHLATPAAALAIRLEHVRKAYKLYDKSFSFLREVLTGRPCHREKPVLEDISLDIRRGEVVGIIGRNGAGKSTLLKLIAGTLAPTDGKITVHGRVSAILELGTGFNPAYSGRDNVIMSALMRGMSEAEVRRKFDAIVAFSGLEDVIDQPFQTYSSGMQARLAFAAAVSVEADVIIIDEALAAGDIRFAARSLRRIREICESGVTALFVSHTTYQVMQLCTRAIWLDNGRIRMDGTPIEVVRAYEYEMQEQIAQDQGRRLPTTVPGADNNPPEGAVELTTAVPASLEGVAVRASLAETSALSCTEIRGDGTRHTQQKVAPTAKTLADLTLSDAKCAQSAPGPRPEKGAAELSFSTEDYRVLDVAFLDQAGQSKRSFRFGDRLRIRVPYQCVLPEPPLYPCSLVVTFYRASDFEPVMYFNTDDLTSKGKARHLATPASQHFGCCGVFDAVIDPVQVRADDYYVSVAIAANRPGDCELHEFPQSQTRLTILPNGFDEPSVFYPIVTWRNGPLAERR